MADRPALRALAEHAGVFSEYVDACGVVQEAPDRTRAAMLAALGIDGSSEDSARSALTALRQADRDRVVSPVRVVRLPLENSERAEESHGTAPIRMSARVPVGFSGPLDWELELAEENGTTRRTAGKADAADEGTSLAMPLPGCPGFGYHRVTVRISDSRRASTAEQALIVAPRFCYTVAEKLGGQRRFGLCLNLYTVRSADNWGVGDLGDLRDLVEWTARAGGAFVGLNPLHALRNRGGDISPYNPVSRLYRNPIYIDVTAVPEFVECAEARSLVTSESFRNERAALCAADRVQYERIWSQKKKVLHALYRRFACRRYQNPTRRHADYEEYLERQGDDLNRFATFLVLEEHLTAPGDWPDWHKWPAEFRGPDESGLEHFRQEHEGPIEFHRFLQFELDRQLGSAAGLARRVGMPIGLYQDLALASAANGCDAWSRPNLFVRDASLGAPPDDYSRTGQNWGLPPLHPHRLVEDGYRYWIRLVRNALAHSGAIRIDHVMGLFRQFWFPRGAEKGTYVRFPAHDLLGILALESRRHNALVIGEDLGTVPPGFSDELARWGILSCRVVYFQQNREGEFLPAREYCDRALVTVSTHDHPPLAGYWQGRDLLIRRGVESIESDEDLHEEQSRRERERRSLLRRLRVEKLLGEDEPPSPNELSTALHAFLARTPSTLIGVMLDDLAGETEPVNIPGVGSDRYANWSRRMRRTIEDLKADAGVRGVMEAARPETGPAA